MSALVLDAGALRAVERGDRAVMAQLRVALERGFELRTSALVLGQVWRDEKKHPLLNRFLQAVEILPVDEALGRELGRLLGRSETDNAADAALVLTAADGDRIITSDTEKFEVLLKASGRRVKLVSC